MALTKLTSNVAIIAALSDLPNATDGLTAAQLKAKFDEAAGLIKTYLNDTLTEEIAAQFATQEEVDGIVLGDIPDGSLTYAKLTPAPSSAAVAGSIVKYDVAGRAQFVDPSANQDAATKVYVDTTAAAARPYAVGTYTGNGAASRDIALAFTPSAVLVMENTGDTGGTAPRGGLAVTGSNVFVGLGSVAVTVGTNKFTVAYGAGSNDARTNVSSLVYNYIALK